MLPRASSWSSSSARTGQQYSKFVGDIFGAPLAAEGVFAFFLESGFLGLYLFGRNRVSKGVHWFSALMVALGSTLSAFWIIVANSWQQTPAGYVLRNGRAELTSFAEAVFNPSTLIRYFHTVDAALIAGAFMMAGIAAYYLLKNREVAFAKKAMTVAMVFGLVASVLELMPLGHEHTRQVAHTQPEKFAAIEGLYTSADGAPLVLFAVPTTQPPTLHGTIEIPGLLSWMAFGDPNAQIKGINEFPANEIPPLWLTFVSFHNMVVLGTLLYPADGPGHVQDLARYALDQPEAPEGHPLVDTRSRWPPVSSAGSLPRSAVSHGSSTSCSAPAKLPRSPSPPARSFSRSSCSGSSTSCSDRCTCICSSRK